MTEPMEDKWIERLRVVSKDTRGAWIAQRAMVMIVAEIDRLRAEVAALTVERDELFHQGKFHD